MALADVPDRGIEIVDNRVDPGPEIGPICLVTRALQLHAGGDNRWMTTWQVRADPFPVAEHASISRSSGREPVPAPARLPGERSTRATSGSSANTTPAARVRDGQRAERFAARRQRHQQGGTVARPTGQSAALPRSSHGEMLLDRDMESLRATAIVWPSSSGASSP